MEINGTAACHPAIAAVPAPPAASRPPAVFARYRFAPILRERREPCQSGSCQTLNHPAENPDQMSQMAGKWHPRSANPRNPHSHWIKYSLHSVWLARLNRFFQKNPRQPGARGSMPRVTVAVWGTSRAIKGLRQTLRAPLWSNPTTAFSVCPAHQSYPPQTRRHKPRAKRANPDPQSHTKPYRGCAP